ncbi:unnamed protein product [Cuscuta europaea]|uniref:Uncharacterized protein n=1 Tax=Cuscuta europaea TaxID=41803 RepID=A0A9P0YJA2_CUSEU|nr:unnamed protein product [Cuscuta europaea]
MMAREDLQWISSPPAKLSEVHLSQLEVKQHRMEDKAWCCKRRSAEPQETECGGAEGGAHSVECGVRSCTGRRPNGGATEAGVAARAGHEESNLWLLLQQFGDCVLA